TFLSHEEIEELAQKVETQPEKREAQRALARAVTEFVHGKEAMEEAEKISQILFSGDIKELTASQVKQVFGKMPSVEVS
ncbi:tyrosine--tRNA ligase, partial [Vibrio parahaemolyticus]